MFVARSRISGKVQVAGAIAVFQFAAWQGSAVAVAELPCVHFDVPEAVAVTLNEDEELQKQYPDELLLTAAFDVSSLIRAGRESRMSQYLYVIESPYRTLSVLDYMPKTELTTTLAGNVTVQKHAESSANLGLNGALPQPSPVVTNGSASLGKSSGTRFNYELLPPKQILLASGTISRGAAVYYKLQASQQTSMDGMKRFVVVFRAPADWRGDYVRLRCAAYDRAGGDNERPICGSSDFLVGLYRAGDDVARSKVQTLTRADRRLRQLARSSQDSVDRQRYPSMTDKIGSFLNVSRPRIPRDWFSRVIRAERPASFEQYLPSELQDAIRTYRDARESVRRLGELDEFANAAS